MRTKIFAAAALAAGMAPGAAAKSPVMRANVAQIFCMNLGKANATANTEKNIVHHTVNAGGDPNEISLKFGGAERLYLDLNGRMVVSMSNGELRSLSARYYQIVDGKKKYVSGNFRVTGANQAGFHVGKYDTSLPLEIETMVHSGSDFRG